LGSRRRGLRRRGLRRRGLRRRVRCMGRGGRMLRSGHVGSAGRIRAIRCPRRDRDYRRRHPHRARETSSYDWKSLRFPGSQASTPGHSFPNYQNEYTGAPKPLATLGPVTHTHGVLTAPRVGGSRMRELGMIGQLQSRLFEELPDSRLLSNPPTMAPPTCSARSAPGSRAEPSLPAASSCSMCDTTQSNLPLVTAALQ
jgi:hypothetical protein